MGVQHVSRSHPRCRAHAAHGTAHNPRNLHTQVQSPSPRCAVPPYAKMVQLKPSSISSTMGATVLEYSFSWSVSPGNTWHGRGGASAKRVGSGGCGVCPAPPQGAASLRASQPSGTPFPCPLTLSKWYVRPNCLPPTLVFRVISRRASLQRTTCGVREATSSLEGGRHRRITWMLTPSSDPLALVAEGPTRGVAFRDAMSRRASTGGSAPRAHATCPSIPPIKSTTRVKKIADDTVRKEPWNCAGGGPLVGPGPACLLGNSSSRLQKHSLRATGGAGCAEDWVIGRLQLRGPAAETRMRTALPWHGMPVIYKLFT